MTSSPIRMVLMGTGPFAVPSFAALAESSHEIAAVVTKPLPTIKSRRGPPPQPVREWASSREMRILDPPTINSDQAVKAVTDLQADLMVVCDYGHILKPDALAATRWGGINLHGSLLPAYRGAAPVQRALLSGDSLTGVSVIHMTPRLDGGPILATRSIEIQNDETSGDLEVRLANLGVEATLEAVQMLIDSNGQPQGRVQDAAKITRAPRLTKDEAEIDWARSARMIDVHVRGMQPWPIAFTHIAISPSKPPMRLAVLDTTPLSITSESSQIGKRIDAPGLVIGCGDGAVRLNRVQPAGKKAMSGDAFVNGYHIEVGAPLIRMER
ncbi:MAG: methionyl-tRNA formyltransferase [Planctomycetota bacterium]